GLNDAIERTPIDDEVLDHRKRARSPRLDPNDIAVLELAHVQLTRRRSADRSMSDAVDHHSARTADSFPAVMLELDRLFAFFDQLLVDHIEHLQKRRVRTDVVRGVFDEASFAVA